MAVCLGFLNIVVDIIFLIKQDKCIFYFEFKKYCIRLLKTKLNCHLFI